MGAEGRLAALERRVGVQGICRACERIRRVPV